MANIAVGSLNLVSTLSPTLLERMPISGSGDPGVLLSTLGFEVNKINRVPVEYGLASSQSTVIAAAITAATAGDVLYFGQGDVRIDTQITQTKNLKVYGRGTRLNVSTNITGWVISSSAANGSEFEGISFVGNNTGAAQIGLATTAVAGFKIRNCNLTSFNVAGLQIGAASNTTPYPLNEITDCRATLCNGIGFNVLATGEYCTFTACGASGNLTGWKLAAGNLTLQGCSGTGGTTGLLVDTGSNNGHLTVQGGHFNHNTTNINVNAITAGNGISFTGVQAFSGNIIFNSDVITWTAGQISATTITTNITALRVLFNGVIIHGTPTIAGTGTANNAWANCYTNLGVAYSG